MVPRFGTYGRGRAGTSRAPNRSSLVNGTRNGSATEVHELMTRINRLGRSLAVAIVALLLIVGVAFARGIALQSTPAGTTIEPAAGADEARQGEDEEQVEVDEPAAGADDGHEAEIEDPAEDADDGNQGNVEDEAEDADDGDADDADDGEQDD